MGRQVGHQGRVADGRQDGGEGAGLLKGRFPLYQRVYLDLRPELAPDDLTPDIDLLDVVRRQFAAKAAVADLCRLVALLRQEDVERIKKKREYQYEQQRSPDGLEHGACLVKNKVYNEVYRPLGI